MKKTAKVGPQSVPLKQTVSEKDPRTLKEPMERWRAQKKAKGKEVEEKEEKENEEKGEAQKKKLVEKVQRKDRKFLDGEDQDRKRKKRKAKSKTDVQKRETSPWEVWKMALSLFVIGQNWLCVNAAAERLQRRTEMMERM